MSKALEAAARAIYERSPFRAEIALGEVLTWQRAHELAAQHPQIRLYLDNCFASARAAITAYLRAVAEDEEAMARAARALSNAIEPETGATDWGGPIPTPTRQTQIRAVLRELEPGE